MASSLLYNCHLSAQKVYEVCHLNWIYILKVVKQNQKIAVVKDSNTIEIFCHAPYEQQQQ